MKWPFSFTVSVDCALVGMGPKVFTAGKSMTGEAYDKNTGQLTYTYETNSTPGGRVYYKTAVKRSCVFVSRLATTEQTVHYVISVADPGGGGRKWCRPIFGLAMNLDNHQNALIQIRAFRRWCICLQ